MKKPNSVVLTTRKVLEGRLLSALDDERVAGILATEQDLKDMIAALYGYQLGVWKGTTLSWEAHVKHRKDLAESLEQLLHEAFPQPRQRPGEELGMKSDCTQAIANRMKTNPVMDMEDELTKVKAQRDALLKACELVLSRWTFGNHQEHTHTWHDMADCKAVIEAAKDK